MARLKAFTLLELTVALLLMSILVAFAYSIIGFMARAADRWSQADVVLEDVRTTHQVITRDIDAGISVKGTPEGFRISERDGRTIAYEVHDGALLRNTAASADTLLRAVHTVACTWQGVSVREHPTDEITITVTTERSEQAITFRKRYDAMTLRAIARTDADPNTPTASR
ncbi:MAG: prepilin-type N-terminal cleavage/methylation domain-containing protein [Flavobacteriales bacterium]